MDKPSELVIKARQTFEHVRGVAPDITPTERKMIADLLDLVLKFPILNADNKEEETT